MTSVESDAALMAPFLDKPGFLLSRVDQISTAIHASLSPQDTLAQAEFLLLLEAVGPLPQIGLARMAGVDKSTTALVLDNLVTAGRAVRQPCTEDRRRTLVSLTDAGRQRVEEVRGQWETLQERLVAPLAAADVTHLQAVLHRLGSNPMGAAPLWVPACHPVVGVLDRSPSFLCRRALQLLQAQFIVSTPGYGMTMRQFSLLFILNRRDVLTQTTIARLYGLDPATCALILRNLVGRGFATAERSQEDGRERLFRITPAGCTALADLQMLVDRASGIVFRGESAAEIRWLVRQLRLITRAHLGILRFPGAMDGLKA